MVKVSWTSLLEAYHFEHQHGFAYGSQLEGTEQVLHMWHSAVGYGHRGKGLGSQYHKERLDYIEDSNGDLQSTTLLTCVVNLCNTAQLKIVRKNGWKEVHRFKSARGLEHPDLAFFVRDVPFEIKYDKDQQADDEADI